MSFVPVLLLATVAFSSSNILPVLSIKQLEIDPDGLDSQKGDNTISNKLYPSNILNDVFYTVSIGSPQNDRRQLLYAENDNNILDYKSSVLNRIDTHNGEGFRKEQWHNYPRQLDRLHKYQNVYHQMDKHNSDPDDPNDYSDDTLGSILSNNDAKSNDILLTAANDNDNDLTKSADNPFLIFKIQLASLNDKLKKADSNKYTDISSGEPEYIADGSDKEQWFKDLMYPEVSVTKVKREEVNNVRLPVISDKSMTKNRGVKKRIFSLWSRLQSFNHKGHELQHRRHLHAFYGLPDSDGGGVLTAETRATFLRPPGSPLRWG
ncbi:hypothetical protein ACJJTC_010076 [Scirpophaga incertulas]